MNQSKTITLLIQYKILKEIIAVVVIKIDLVSCQIKKSMGETNYQRSSNLTTILQRKIITWLPPERMERHKK